MNVQLERIQEKREFLEMAVQHFRELNPKFVPARDWQEHYFENIQGNHNYFLRWIVIDGERCGFVLFGIEPHRFLPRSTGAIYELYVTPEQRRRGVGMRGAEMVVQELRKLMPSSIQLEVADGNRAAAQLWQKIGFRKISERFVLRNEP